jgi:tetratricopeptide (TPR) repeat protein
MFESLQTAIDLREGGQYEESRRLLLELLQTHPDDPQVNYHCAWAHDRMGLERAAVPFYEQAIAHGLSGDDLAGALLGLGSTYRCLGMYDAAAVTLQKGCEQFPTKRAFEAFLAMTFYNLGRAKEAVELLLRLLAETSQAPEISQYRRALTFYAKDLDQIWD